MKYSSKYIRALLQDKRFLIGFVVITLLTFFIAFFQLGESAFDNWDEAWYAEMTRQMIVTNDFITPHWNDQIRLDKPPMYMWISAAVASVFGLSEFSMRITSALSGVAIILLVYVYSYKKYGFIPAALAFVTLACNNLFIYRVRSGNLDLLVSLFILATFFAILSRHKYKYALLGVLFACIFLTKTSLVAFPLVIFFFHEIFYERKNFKKNISGYIQLMMVFVIPISMWLLLGYMKLGPTFPEYYLFKSDQGVAKIDITKFNPNYLSYTYYSLQRRFFFVLLIGVGFLFLHIKKRKEHALLLLYGFLLLIELSFTERNNNWYLVPSMPFWSIIIAFGTYSVMKLFRNNIIVVLLIVVVSGYVSVKTYRENILPILSSSTTQAQAESSNKLRSLSQKNDIIVRLDHLYPTTIYYTDRRVLSSPLDVGTGDFFISRDDLKKMIEKKELRWVVGKNGDIDMFVKDSTISGKRIMVNSEESILQMY